MFFWFLLLLGLTVFWVAKKKPPFLWPPLTNPLLLFFDNRQFLQCNLLDPPVFFCCFPFSYFYSLFYFPSPKSLNSPPLPSSRFFLYCGNIICPSVVLFPLLSATIRCGINSSINSVRPESTAKNLAFKW